VDTTGASVLVVSASGFQSFGSTGTLTDSKSNTWVGLTERGSNGNAFQRLWYCENPTVGSGHTFTIAGGAYGTFEVAAFSGAKISGVYDTSTGTLGSSASAQPGSVTPANADSLFVVGLAYQNNGATLSSIDSGFTIANNESGGGVIQGALAYLIQSGTTAENPTWTLSGSDNWVTSIVVLVKASSNITTTQTLLGKARIQVTTTQTLAGKARIRQSVLQTLLGKANINSVTNQTLLGKANILGTTSQTLSGKARVTIVTTRTLAGRARIKITTLQTLLGKAAIVGTTTKTLTGKARLGISTTQDLLGIAAINQSTDQFLLGQARILATTLQTLMGQARIFHQTHTNSSRTFQALADGRDCVVVPEPTRFYALTDTRHWKVLE